MLVRQTAIYFAANVFSALFGFFNVVVFTRMFAAEAFGQYLLGFGFAAFFSTLLATSLKRLVLREQSRGDGTDVRGLVLAALILCCLFAPLGYGLARLANLDSGVAAASIALSFAIVLFDTSQEVLRAEQKTMAIMRNTMLRAALVSLFGLCCTKLGTSGALLLISSTLGYLLAALASWRSAWGASTLRFEAAGLLDLFKSGLPLTLSLTLLAISGLADRFLIANIIGPAAAGQFGASLDLVRQSLIIPAISVASAFVPMTVQLLATRGDKEAQAHLDKCLELLLAIALPACIGFAIVSPQLADLALGPDFRQTARDAMPILAVAVVFQILTQQYLHTSFLLSNRNIFYLVNTGSILAFNLILSFVLISRFGIMGAVWGRLASEIFGFLNALALSRFSFAMPFSGPRLIRVAAAVGAMALVVRLLSLHAAGYGPAALVLLLPAGIVSYAAAAWLLDIGEVRSVAQGIARVFGKISGQTA